MKTYETKILSAEEKIHQLESQLYNDLVLSMADYITTVQLNGALLAKLDCLYTFSQVAIENNYVKPTVNDSFALEIKDGRHPVH